MKVSEDLIREIVQRVLAESGKTETKEDFVKEKDPSGIIKIQTDTVKCEPVSYTHLSGRENSFTGSQRISPAVQD